MGDEPTSIATFLKKDLEELGYVVVENLGASTFKVDLAISEKNKPNEFVLGVIIDNSKNASLTCRDRHINEPFVLNRLRWNIHHLYSVEYLDHKEEVIKDIVNAFNRSLNGERLYEDVSTNKDPLFVKKVVDVSPNKKPYVRAEYVPERGPNAMNEVDMFAFFMETIGTEYPISLELLESRFRETFDLGRIGSVVRNKFTLALKGYDILGQAKNLSVSDNSNYHSEVINNTLGRYIILSLTWRFGTFDRNNMRGPGGRGPGGFGGPGGRGPR